MAQYNRIFTEYSAFICRFTVDPARRQEFIDTFTSLWTQYIDTMEEHCNFAYYGWGRDPNQLFCVESWKSEEAMNLVRADPRFQDLVGKMILCCSAPMNLQILSGLEADRSVFDLYPEGKSERHPSADGLESEFA